jgi:AraC-like DNA-binding protein
MPIDPLSDVLSIIKPRTYVAGGFNMGGDWSVRFNSHDGIKCFAVVSGSCWLTVDGESEPIRLEEGDCVLLPNGRHFTMARDPAFNPIPIGDVPEADWRGGIATVNGGGDAMILGGHFAFSGPHTEMLLGAMPSILRLRGDSDKVDLRWALERMRHELSEGQPGGIMVVEHLAHLLLVQALRLYLSRGLGRTTGFLFALSDPKIAAAVGAIHASPGERWTLPMLAGRAGMSRSKFALRFKTIAGSSPIEYLTRWRMLLACDRLMRRSEPVSVIALSLGYQSEAAFSTAFKRVIGCPPRRYADQA